MLPLASQGYLNYSATLTAPAAERAEDRDVVCGEEMTYRQLVVHPQTALAPWPVRTRVTKFNLKYIYRERGRGAY